MGYALKKSVSLNEILAVLNMQAPLGSDEVLVSHVAASEKAADNTLCFSKSSLDNHSAFICFIDQKSNLPSHSTACYIPCENPRLDFIRALNYLDSEIGFSHFDFPSQVHPSVQIGQNVVIENGCQIAEGVILEHNVVIHKGTTIGKNSRIRANSSIGGDGFGFERYGEEEMPIRFPHLAGVEIGENVEIGSNTCVARGVLSNTIIENFVKIDNLVHIAHNCHIEEGAFIIACSEISGGVRVGKNAWIAPNSCTMQKVTIGNHSIIGLGAVVTKDVPENCIYAGNPAKLLRNL